MIVPPEVIYPALALGLGGLTAMFVGAYLRSRLSVVIGQLIVSGHISMYYFGSGEWPLAIGCLSMLTGATVYRTKRDGPWLILWLLFTLPPSAVYLLFMGIWLIYVIARGP